MVETRLCVGGIGILHGGGEVGGGETQGWCWYRKGGAGGKRVRDDNPHGRGKWEHVAPRRMRRPTRRAFYVGWGWGVGGGTLKACKAGMVLSPTAFKHSPSIPNH